MKRLFLFAGVALLSLRAFAQSADEKAAAIKDMVESKNFIFQAQTALPMRGNVRHLTTEYDLKVTPTAVVSELPYFGRAFVAPMNPTQSPLQFTSTKFDYTATTRKSGGWEIVIKPTDHREVQSMTLTISTAGYTTLQVTNLNRDPITFNGDITAPRKK
ncbi:MAG TPA: DUF4251 domain-containing protein [Puia sp.]|jgi:hypothetical protein|nr:DUF4251 domain-containing protein [Puia sp.]